MYQLWPDLIHGYSDAVFLDPSTMVLMLCWSDKSYSPKASHAPNLTLGVPIPILYLQEQGLDYKVIVIPSLEHHYKTIV